MSDSLFSDALSDLIVGARIKFVTPHDGPVVKVEFEHRGTDEGSGYFLVGPSTVAFDDPSAAIWGGDGWTWER